MKNAKITTEEVKEATIQDFLELVLNHVANQTNNSPADELEAALVILKPKGDKEITICPLSAGAEGLGFFLELPKLAKEISESTVKETLKAVAGKMADDLISETKGGSL